MPDRDIVVETSTKSDNEAVNALLAAVGCSMCNADIHIVHNDEGTAVSLGIAHDHGCTWIAEQRQRQGGDDDA